MENKHGGQSWQFLEEILQKIDENIHVFENVPLRNPRDSNIGYPSCCDNQNMVCDGKIALCDFRIGDENFIPTLLMNDTSEPYNFPADSKFWETCFLFVKT